MQNTAHHRFRVTETVHRSRIYQLTPSAMARRIVSSDTLSSCCPHPYAPPPPPIAHAPNPTVVISSPLEPSERLLICIIPPQVFSFQVCLGFHSSKPVPGTREESFQPILNRNAILQCERS